jgi:hypothetical protein
MNKDFFRFTKRLFILGSPLVLLVVSYFIFDPFQVLRTYENYPDNYGKTVNRNRISTQMYLNGKGKFHYQSFILGSSRSSVFYAKDYGKYINDSLVFHFDASNEIIGGIANKLAFIDKNGGKIKNALVLIDEGNFNYPTDTAGTIFIQDYRVAPQISAIKYHIVFLNSFFSEGYFIKFFDFKLFKKLRAYMNGAFEHREIHYTPVNNDFIFTSYIKAIEKDSLGYYKGDYFYERTGKEEEFSAYIKPHHVVELQKIAALFKKHSTNYQLIMSPSFHQKKLNKEDQKIIESIFDKNRIFDYSGVNELTTPIGNYYEIFHFKPLVAREIMKEIFVDK